MKFKIIANEHTPKVEAFLDGDALVSHYKLFTKFLAFARRQHNCAGLAANQVSLNGTRIALPFFACHYDSNFWDVIINPVILEYRGKAEVLEERCLTWIGRVILARRYPDIVVQYDLVNGNPVRETLTGRTAQIWQHECDHLNGILENFKGV
jgi:peptide deformylase